MQWLHSHVYIWLQGTTHQQCPCVSAVDLPCNSVPMLKMTFLLSSSCPWPDVPVCGLRAITSMECSPGVSSPVIRKGDVPTNRNHRYIQYVQYGICTYMYNKWYCMYRMYWLLYCYLEDKIYHHMCSNNTNMITVETHSSLWPHCPLYTDTWLPHKHQR